MLNNIILNAQVPMLILENQTELGMHKNTMKTMILNQMLNNSNLSDSEHKTLQPTEKQASQFNYLFTVAVKSS